jgi:PKD repeat protein
MYWMTLLKLSLAALVLLLAGCAGQDTEPKGIRPQTGAWLPAPSRLPAPLNRDLAFTDSDRTKLGADFDPLLPNALVSVEATAAVFSPAATEPGDGLSGLAYALYRFELPGYADSPLISVLWSTPPADESIWLGLANFVADRWDWYALPAADQLLLESLLPYIEQDNLLLAVAATGTAPAGLALITVGDDVIPLADIAADPDNGVFPLEVQFSAAGSSDSDGTIVQYEWDLDGDGTYELDSGADPAAGFTYTQQGSFSARLQVTDDKGATATDMTVISVNDPDANPPSAALTATPDFGDAVLLVTLDASGSTDDLGIVNYDYDFDGDGTCDLLDSVDSSVSHNYAEVGQFDAVVRVEDAAGATDTATTPIDVDGDTVAFLNVSPDCGSDSRRLDASSSYEEGGQIVSYRWDYTADGTWDSTTTEAVLNGVYYDWGTYIARVEVTDDDGDTAVDEFGPIHATGWNSSSRLLSGSPGAGLSVRSINAERAVLYDDNAIMYGQGQGAAHIVSTKNPPNASKMMLGSTLGIGGVQYPVAVFYNSDGDLVCARATKVNPSATADWQVHNIDSASSNYSGGYNLGLATLGLASSGRILVSYFDTSDGELYFAVSETAYPDSESDWTRHIVASQNNVTIGESQSLLMVGGEPVIAYSYGTAALYYARSTVALPDSSADWVFHLVHNPGTYTGISLALHSSVPTVSFTRSGTLYFGFANSAEPVDFGDWSIHSLRNDCGWHTALCSANGAPVIVFTDVSQGFGREVVGCAVAETPLPGSMEQWCMDMKLFGSYGLGSLQVSGSVFDSLPLVGCYFNIGGYRAYSLWGRAP